MEDHVLVDPAFRIQRVVGAPIAELFAKGGDQPGDGVSSRTNQMGQQVLAQPPGATMGRRDFAFALAPQVFPSAQERRVVFFSITTGEGGTTGRWAMMLALSSMIHSMVSPFWNSIASATAVGK